MRLFRYFFWKVKSLDKIIVELDKSSVQVNEAKVQGSYPFFTSGEEILAFDDYFVDGFNCFLNTGGKENVHILLILGVLMQVSILI